MVLKLLLNFLEHTSAVIIVALITGLIFDFSILRNYLTIILVIAMSFSLTSFVLRKRIFGKTVGALLLLAANYLLLPVVILSLSFLLLREFEYIVGFLIYALMPPAVIAIPYVYIFKGEKAATLLAEIFGYLSALLIVPLVFYAVFRQGINLAFLFAQLFLFIAVPLGISRGLILLKAKTKVDLYEKQIINCCLFFLNAAVLSLNRQNIFALITLHPIWVILIVKTIVLPIVIYFGLRRIVSKECAVSFTIFSSVKNSTLGMVLALSIFSPPVAIPLVLSTVFGVLTPILFALLFKR